MESKDVLKEIGTKNRTCNFGNVLLNKKSY